MREVGHRGKVGLAEGAEHSDSGVPAVVQGVHQLLGELGPHARGAAGQRIRQAEHRRADDLGGRVRAGADQVVRDQGSVEGADLLGGDRHLLLRADAGRHPVDDVAPFERPLHERPGRAHSLDGLRGERDVGSFARDRHDLTDREAPAVE